MGKKAEYLLVVRVKKSDGSVSDIGKMNDDELRLMYQNMKKRLENALSCYYSSHTEEYSKLKEKG